MYNKTLLFLLFGLLPMVGFSQAEHLLFVTSDGVRWQEVFEGADSALLFNCNFVADTALYRKKYWSSDPEERRRKLMPFLWKIVAAEGQLYGNRRLGSRVDMANQIRISYPGYAEILTGRANPRIVDNHPWRDRNTNVLQFLAQKPPFFENIAVFSSWSNLYFVLNAQECNFSVNAANKCTALKNGQKEPLPEDTPLSTGILHTLFRPDSITWQLAQAFLEKKKPSILYVSLMETDELAHEARYDATLDAIHTLDSLTGDLWQRMQNDPEYRGKTALFLTTDHGRGRGGFWGNWQVHNHVTAGSRGIWFAVMSPDLPPLGEVSGRHKKIKAKQFARTMAALVGVDFDKRGRGKAISLNGPRKSAGPIEEGKIGLEGRKR